MGLPSTIVRCIALCLLVSALIFPWLWNECVLAIHMLSGIGLAIVGITVVSVILATDGGDELHCEVIEGLLGCLMIIAGLLQIAYDGSNCNVIMFLFVMLLAGVAFIIDMVLKILGK